MSEHLSAWPTTDEVRATFGAQDRLAFDRWLAALERGDKAEAWDEGVSALLAAHRWNNAEPWLHLPPNPYRIESQETP